jgi:hypothetical protein
MKAFALVMAGTEWFAVPVSDADRDRLIVGGSASFQMVNGSPYCALMTDAKRERSPEAPGMSPPGTKTSTPGF